MNPTITRGDEPAPAGSVAEWKRTTGTDVDERLIVEALEQLRQQGWLGDAATPLPKPDAEFLAGSGGVRDNRPALIRARVSSAVRARTVAAESLSVEQAAGLLGISASRVRRRISDGSIYAYPSAAGRGVARRIPKWQFRSGLPIPHLASVLADLPECFRPDEIRSFAQQAEIDHPLRDRTVPLLDWLWDGGDPEPARALAAAQLFVI